MLESNRNDDNIASEMQMIRSKFTIQTNDRAYKEQDWIALINYLKGCKRAYHFSEIHLDAAVCLL